MCVSQGCAVYIFPQPNLQGEVGEAVRTLMQNYKKNGGVNDLVTNSSTKTFLVNILETFNRFLTARKDGRNCSRMHMLKKNSLKGLLKKKRSEKYPWGTTLKCSLQRSAQKIDQKAFVGKNLETFPSLFTAGETSETVRWTTCSCGTTCGMVASTVNSQTMTSGVGSKGRSTLLSIKEILGMANCSIMCEINLHFS